MPNSSREIKSKKTAEKMALASKMRIFLIDRNIPKRHLKQKTTEVVLTYLSTGDDT